MYENFEEDFVRRTKDCMQQLRNWHHREVTLLLNFSFGLLIFPKEKMDKNKFLASKVFSQSDFSSWTIKEDNIAISMTPWQILRNLRNALAHSHIRPYCENEQDVKELVFHSTIKRNHVQHTIEIVVSTQDFQLFLEKVVDCYLAKLKL